MLGSFRPIADIQVAWNKRLMRVVLRVPWIVVACVACDGSHPQSGDSGIGYVERYNGDPKNYTGAGFSRHSYPVKDCGTEIALQPPFQVGDGGVLTIASIHAPVSLIDQPETTTYANEGPSDQERLSFDYPSRFGGRGLSEMFAGALRAGTHGPPLPPTTIAETLASPAARTSFTRFQGKLNGRSVAIECSFTDVPNPTCMAEVGIGSQGRRYRVIYPTKVAGRLDRILQIGDELFRDADAACQQVGSDRSP